MKTISNQAAKMATDICKRYIIDTSGSKDLRVQNTQRKAKLLMKKIDKAKQCKGGASPS